MSHPFGRHGFSVGPGHIGSGPTTGDLAQEFLVLDSVFATGDESAEALAVVEPDHVFRSQWSDYRDGSFEIVERFMAASSGSIGVLYDHVGLVRDLVDTRRRGEKLLERHRDSIHHSIHTVKYLPQRSRSALEAASQVLELFDALETGLRSAPRVLDAERDLKVALDQVGDVEMTGDLPGLFESTVRLEGLISRAEEELREAPRVARHAPSAATAARTRHDAIAYRLGAIPGIRGQLLREFSLGNYSDLDGNEDRAERHLERAAATLSRVNAESIATHPLDALAIVKSARAHLDAAEDLVDAFRDRLYELREVASDPARFAARARFRIRDARQVASQRGSLDRWSVALDSQSERVDRAEAALGGVHPDYLSFVREIESIDEFVQAIIGRMKSGA